MLAACKDTSVGPPPKQGYLEWVQPTQRHRLGAVEARTTRKAAEHRGAPGRVRPRPVGRACHAVLVRYRFDRVGEDVEAFIQVLIIHDQRRNQPTRLVHAGRQREQAVCLALLRNLTSEARERLIKFHAEHEARAADVDDRGALRLERFERGRGAFALSLMPGKSFAAAVTLASSEACNVRATEHLRACGLSAAWNMPIGACVPA